MGKKNVNLIGLMLLATVCLFMQGCKTKSDFIREPFGEYRSDSVFFRLVGLGEDADLQRAKSKAMHNAKVEIARNAQSVCQQVVLDYLNQTGNNDNVNLKEQFISVSTESVSESLVNVEVEDVIYKKDKNNHYTCYAKVKVRKDNVFDTFADRTQDKMNINSGLLKQIINRVVNQINTQQ